MQIKPVLRFFLTQSKWLSSGKLKTKNVGEDVGKTYSYTLLVGMQITATTIEIAMEIPQNKNKK
jgi:hypothetical protein